jgi:hypothetical protein
MRRILRGRRPSPAMAVAMLALFVALGGGAYAATALPARSVGNDQLRNRSVSNDKLRKHAVTSSKLALNSVAAGRVVNDSLTGADINEKKLGPVDDADKLGGQPASAYQHATRWALVRGTATDARILAQSGGMSVQRAAAGTYFIGTGASVASQPLAVSLSRASGTGGGSAVVAPCGGSGNNPGGVNCGQLNTTSALTVRTFNPNGQAADKTFYVEIG